MSDLLLDFEPDSGDEVPQNVADCRAPGIHRDVSFEEYASWRAINSGIIKWGRISQKHMHAAVNGLIANDDTKDKKLGRAIHSRILEPETFHERFIISEPCDAVIKTGKRAGVKCGNTAIGVDNGKWFCGVKGHGPEGAERPDNLLTDDEMRRVDGVDKSLKSLPADIKALLRRPGWAEVSIVFEHKGHTLKGRLDRYSEGKRPLVLDLKKCQVGKGDKQSCQKAIANYGYFVQMALYVKGMEILTGVRPEAIWIFVEDNDPFDFNVIPADDNDITIGWEIVCQTLRMYSEAIDDPWGYIRVVEAIRPGGLPAWFVKEWQEKKHGI